MEPKVFISHSSKDKTIADAICRQLESAGIRCWVAPRDIEVGSDWTEGIMRGIARCRVFVLVFSAHANDSEHVRREMARAFSLGLAVIPFRTEAIVPRVQGEQSGPNAGFAETREQLNQKVQKSAGNADLLSQLAVIDALLNNKEVAISEAKRAVELLSISKDALDGPGILQNLAVVFAWTNELDLAFEKLSSLTRVPGGIFYGQLKRQPFSEPLRHDPRYEKLLAELAPRD
jgi:hypothetical protein